MPKFWPQWKDRTSSYQVRQILALFCNLITLILGENYVKGLRITKIDNDIKFEGVWVELEAKNCFQRPTLVFMQNSILQEKFNFCFWRVLC